MKLRPWLEVLRNAQELLERSTGPVEVFQQWQCVHCGEQQTMSMPNMFYEHGRCELCDHMTNIKQDGHGFAIVVTRMSSRTVPSH